MEKTNPLLPFAFDISKVNDKSVPLSTLPRGREERDQNAGGTIFHTRGYDTKRKLLHDQSPEKLNGRKSRRYHTSDMITSDDFETDESWAQGTSTQKQAKGMFSSSEFNAFPSSDSAIPGRMPSSPPLQVHRDDSDDEFNPLADKSFVIPSSPQRYEQTEDFQVPSQPKMPHTLSARALKQKTVSQPFVRPRTSIDEFDFGLDKFNRVQGVHSDQPSSEIGEEEFHSQRTSQSLSGETRAREIIGQCFENQRTELHLDNLELSKIPDEIEDLKDLVTFTSDGFITQPKLQIYMSHNNIKSITPRLFELCESVEVLSVRSNKIKSIPGAISKLTNLNYLNVVSNLIQTVPHQVLDLANLQKLLVRPNPSLLELERFSNVKELKKAVPRGNNVKRFIGRVKFINRHHHAINPAAIKLTKNFSILSQASDSEFSKPFAIKAGFDTFDEDEQIMLRSHLSSAPKLSELCLRVFSDYKTSKSETKKWSQSVGISTSKLIAKALHQGAYGESCSVCGHTVIQFVAEVLEWWDIADSKVVPIRKQFCCGGCVRAWENEHLELV